MKTIGHRTLIDIKYTIYKGKKRQNNNNNKKRKEKKRKRGSTHNFL